MRYRRATAARFALRPLAAALAAGAFGWIPTSLSAATINVGGACSLANAIASANLDSAVGGCTAGSGSDTVRLPVGGSLALTSALPDVSGALIIDGRDSSVVRAASAPAFRILTVTQGAVVEVRDLSLSGGVEAFGGGISNAGTLTLLRSTVSGNSAQIGGGGVFSKYGASLSILDSHISGNRSDGIGGGIDTRGVFLLERSTVSANTTEDDGGGIHPYDTTSTIRNSTISGNSPAGIGSYAPGRVDISDSTITGNQGPGFFSQGGRLNLARSIVSGNAGREILIDARSSSVESHDNVFGHSGRTTAEAFGTFRPFVPSPTDIVAASDGNLPTPLENILDIVLADNGGQTPTHALPAGSPAIDGVDAGCPDIDQRGIVRPQDLGCDIGAFESEPIDGAGPQLSFSSSLIEAPESQATVRVMLQLSEPAKRAVRAPLLVSGSATRGKDFTVRQVVTIPAGQTEQAFDVRLRNDRIDEQDETVILRFGALTGAQAGSRVQTRIVIADEDPMPLASFSLEGSRMPETQAVKNVVVRLDRPSDRELVVQLGYSGTASFEDFDAPTELRFAPGAVRAVIPVRPIDDLEAEDPETIEIEMIGFGDPDREFGEEAGIGPGERTRHTLRLQSNE